MKRRALAVGFLALAMAGCGPRSGSPSTPAPAPATGGTTPATTPAGGGGGETAPTPVPAATPAPAGAATPAPTMAPAPAMTPAPAATTVTVSEQNFRFMPADVTVPVGSTVVWRNDDASTPHTSTADGGSWDSGNMNAGATFSHTFTAAGTFPYHCTYHQGMGMVGTITVR